MYVRCYRDSIGRIFLQQYLRLESGPKNGKMSEVTSKWENVTTIGAGQSEALDLPIGNSCGIMIFECLENIFAGVNEGHKEVKVTYVVSALEIYKVTPKEDGIQVFTKDKLALTVRMSYIEFTEMMINLLNNFKIIRFDINGRKEKE